METLYTLSISSGKHNHTFRNIPIWEVEYLKKLYSDLYGSIHTKMDSEDVEVVHGAKIQTVGKRDISDLCVLRVRGTGKKPNTLRLFGVVLARGVTRIVVHEGMDEWRLIEGEFGDLDIKEIVEHFMS